MDRIDSTVAPRALESFSLARFESFYEVARLGSVGSAARALGRSQPAISHRLRALQDELGVELFEKVGRTLQLTEAGQRLRDRCPLSIPSPRRRWNSSRPTAGSLASLISGFRVRNKALCM